MWSPEGYISWSQVVNKLLETVEEVVTLVCLADEPNSGGNGKLQLGRGVEFHLKNKGFADNYEEGQLIVSIITVFLLVNFLEENPPVLSNLGGNKLTGEWPLFCHKDQIEACYLHWPIKDDLQFQSFFRYIVEGNFGPNDLFDRFAFIQGATGQICLKNGSSHYLINGLGYPDEVASNFCRVAKQLSNYFIFWPSFPDDEQYRDFLSCIEINDTFTKAIDRAYGSPASEPAVGAGLEHTYHCFRNVFPNGKGKVPWHIVEKKTGYSRRQINRALRAYSEQDGRESGQDAGQHKV